MSTSYHLMFKFFSLLFFFHFHVVFSSNLVLGKPQPVQGRRPNLVGANQTTCDLFNGSWVVDTTYPLYNYSNCPSIIDPEFNCQMFGRPDTAYLKYRWKPDNCELPRFNAQNFLAKMRGKTVMFVGDSLGRNQWESLICMLSSAVLPSQTEIIRRDPLSTFKFLTYSVSISFYRAPYLVDIDNIDGKRVLKLDEISQNSRTWKGVDVLSFNSGHWWIHKGALQGWDLMEMERQYYTDMDRLVALDRGLRTWAKWVDSFVVPNKTRLFFQAISPTHYNGKELLWGDITSEWRGLSRTLSGPNEYSEQCVTDMANPAYLLDITTLPELRKDGHPSIYSGDLSPQQRANPERSADCSHWCLPGLPDTWNKLFITALLY